MDYAHIMGIPTKSGIITNYCTTQQQFPIKTDCQLPQIRFVGIVYETFLTTFMVRFLKLYNLQQYLHVIEY